MAISYITKNQRATGAQQGGGATIVIPITPNTIDGLIGTNITMSLSNQSLLVTKGSLLAQVVITEIITWSIEGLVLTILTEDPSPLELTFISTIERDIAVGILEAAINL